MKRNVLSLLGVLLAVALVALLAGYVTATEAETEPPQSDRGFVSCSKWMNCDTESPNYTGFCCRPCKDAQGRSGWECQERAPAADRASASSGEHSASGDTTFAGIVTLEGIMNVDDGQVYALSGRRSARIQRNIGKEIEVKGTVQETEGKVAIDVESVRVMPPNESGEEQQTKAHEAFASCGDWKNCNSLGPNYTGTCCRQCKDKEGEALWDCKVFSELDHFDMAEWKQLEEE